MSEDEPGIEAWIEHTSAFDRVQSIASTVSQPRSAAYIAHKARVAENTARGHLERLVDLNVLLTHDEDGTVVYAPDPLHTRMQTIRDLLDSHDHDGLIRLKADLQERIDTSRREYGVESPEELRTLAADTNDSPETREIRRAASEWELLEYRLEIVEDAIENYVTYTRDSRASA